MPDCAAEDVYGDYIDRVAASQLFRRGVWRWRRAGRAEVMLPALVVGGAAGKIMLSLLSAVIMSRCRCGWREMVVRVEAAGGPA